MVLSLVQPKHIRYIKLGSSGYWAQQSFSEGVLCFGYETIPHQVCEQKDWGEVWNLLRPYKKNDAAATHGRNEIRDFYELGEDCLWITFADGHLWWAFAHPEVKWVWDNNIDHPPRKRTILDRWQNTDINGKALRFADLSSKLTQVSKFQRTICHVPDEGYLLRRINHMEQPVVIDAREARKAMMAVAVRMIRELHPADFETLTDLIFAKSGWQRVSPVGGNLPDIDLAMEQPTTGEIAFVQVKSKAGQATVDDYLGRIRRSGYDRFFFVCHSAQGKLTLPDGPGLHLFEGERLADAAVKNGLYDWLIERSG